MSGKPAHGRQTPDRIRNLPPEPTSPTPPVRNALPSPSTSTRRPPLPTTPRRNKRPRLEDMLSPGPSRDRTLMCSPSKNAAAHALRSSMRNNLTNNPQSLDEEDDQEDTYSLLMHREILDSPSKRGRLIGPSPTNNSNLPPPVDSPLNPKYLRTSLSAASQSLIVSPQQKQWAIPETPYKILDAPELQDDYYLNLLDWSSTDILGVGLGACVYLWSASSSKVTKLCDLGPNDSITSVGWMQRGTHVAIGTDSGMVQLWDIEREKRVRQFSGHTKRVGTIAWSSELLTTGSRDKTILQRDARMRQPEIRRLNGHTAEVCGMKWSQDETLLASGGNDNQLCVWDKRFDNHNPIWKPESPHQAAIKALTWSPHKRYTLASGGGTADRKIKIWNVQTGHTMNQIDTNSQVCNLVWGKHTEHLISTHGYSRNHINVWKPTESGLKEIATLTGHTSRVVYLAMSPDGTNIVTGAGDETLRFWKIFNPRRPRVPGIDTSTCII